MLEKQKEIIRSLIQKGVKIPCPENIEIGSEVQLDRISGENTIIHTGCKIYGEKTLILPDAVIGEEAPATIKNCWVGPSVRLKGGFFDRAVFLDHAQMGSCAHVRQGTILEEYASGAHTVGLKQTILMPFVTLGSLINFCDCLMAGGTSRKNHSEVGSSYIHFNYTPNQDKATASLIGDVPRGVMLNQSPIFLGGQGGLVGPCRIAYGTVIAAGSVYRRDIIKENQLAMDGAMRHATMTMTKHIYQAVHRIVENNFLYMANLVALFHWYHSVRGLWTDDPMQAALHAGLCETIQAGLDERIKQFNLLCEKMPASIEAYLANTDKSGPLIETKKQLYGARHKIIEVFQQAMTPTKSHFRDQFLETLSNIKQKSYIESIQTLDTGLRINGVQWLQEIVDSVYHQANQLIGGE